MTISRAAFLLAAFFLPGTTTLADEIHLANGRSLEGVARTLEDGRVEVRTALGSVVLAPGTVARIDAKQSLEESMREAVARLDARDADGRYALARECAAQGATTLARQLFQATLAIDPGHAGARQALEFRRFGDRWVSEEEYHGLRGEVPFRGAWVSVAERERVLDRETAQLQLEIERQRAAARTAELAAQSLLAAQAAQAQPMWVESEGLAGPSYFAAIPGGVFGGSFGPGVNPFCCAPPFLGPVQPPGHLGPPPVSRGPRPVSPAPQAPRHLRSSVATGPRGHF